MEAIASGLGLREDVCVGSSCMFSGLRLDLSNAQGRQVSPSKHQNLASTFSYKVVWPASNTG